MIEVDLPFAYPHGSTLRTVSSSYQSGDMPRRYNLHASSLDALHETVFGVTSQLNDWLRRHLYDTARGTYIQRLNSAVPDDVSPKAGCGPAYHDVIINGYTLGPQHLALLRTRVGVILEPNGCWLAIVSRVGAHAAAMTLVPLPVGWDNAVALWTSSGGVGPITSGRRRQLVDSFRARRLHPFTAVG
jgi:hypothetical protein